METIYFEAFLDGQWKVIGEASLQGTIEQEFEASINIEYEIGYATHHLGQRDAHALSVNYPVDLALHSLSRWPGFIIDLVPQGAHRRYLLSEWGKGDSPQMNWELLKKGATNPPGNVRVQYPTKNQTGRHPGFTREEVLSQKEDFLEYMIAKGAPVSGSSGAGGDAVKFLLREDAKGKFHADSILPPEKTRHFWIVKFTRGKKASDRDILKAEAAYSKLARHLGVCFHEELEWEDDCLFIPRFDRKLDENKQLICLGMESLYAAMDLIGFGPAFNNWQAVETIHHVSTQPKKDVLEYFIRDILNYALGNTDNHGRNTAFLKNASGHIYLSPLFDFAPMFYDDRGITRKARWGDNFESGVPNLAKINKELIDRKFVDPNEAANRLNYLASRFESILPFLAQENCPSSILERITEKLENAHLALKKAIEK